MSLRGQVRVACEALGDSTALQIIFEGREQAAYPIMMMVQMTAARELFRDNVHGMSGQVQAQKQRGRRSHPSSSDASCRRSSTSVMFMASVVKVGAMLFGKVGRLRMCGGGGVGDGGVCVCVCVCMCVCVRACVCAMQWLQLILAIRLGSPT